MKGMYLRGGHADEPAKWMYTFNPDGLTVLSSSDPFITFRIEYDKNGEVIEIEDITLPGVEVKEIK